MEKEPREVVSITVLNRGFKLFIVVLLLFILSISLFSLWNTHSANLSVTDAQLKSSLNIFTENVNNIVISLDGVMLATADRITLTDCIDECLHSFLVQQKTVNPMLRVLLVVGPDGVITVDSRTPMEAVGIDVSDRPYFQIHLQNPEQDLFIGPPNRSRVNNEWSMPISRAVRDVDGNLQGVVVASLEPRYFEQLMEFMDLEGKEEGRQLIQRVTITLDDTTILSHFPYGENVIGQPLNEVSDFESLQASPVNEIVYSHRLPIQRGSMMLRQTLEPSYPIQIFLSAWPITQIQSFQQTTLLWGIAMGILMTISVAMATLSLRQTSHLMTQSQHLQNEISQRLETEQVLRNSETLNRSLLQNHIHMLMRCRYRQAPIGFHLITPPLPNWMVQSMAS